MASKQHFMNMLIIKVLISCYLDFPGFVHENMFHWIKFCDIVTFSVKKKLYQSNKTQL